MRTTRIRDIHGAVWYFPNGEIRRVVNESQQFARSVLDIEVAYDTDIGRAIEVIEEAAASVWREQPEDATILERPEIQGVEELGDSGVAIRLVITTEPGEQWTTGRRVRRRIKEAFDEAGIVIPFPQQDIHVRNAAVPPVGEQATRSSENVAHERVRL